MSDSVVAEERLKLWYGKLSSVVGYQGPRQTVCCKHRSKMLYGNGGCRG